jgi:hypothetical protein
MGLSTVPPMALSLLFGVLSCLVALAIGHPFVRLLRLYRVGKAIQVELPDSHAAKAGTPTMGGLLICTTVVVVTGLVVSTVYVAAGHSILLPLGVLVASAILGAVDDRTTLQGRSGEGLSERSKLLWTVMIGTASALALWHPDLLGIDYVFLPTIKTPFHPTAWTAWLGGRRSSRSWRSGSWRTCTSSTTSSRSASPWPARWLRSSGSTPSRPSCSWVTPARWRSARRSRWSP